MSKIEIEESLLDNLILKSLPPEYEVLLYDDALSEEEQEYYYYILLILDGQIDEVKKWVTSDTFKKLLEDVENLPLNFFDDFKLKMRVYLQDKFELLLLPLLLDYYKNTNNLVYSSMNIKPILTDNDLLNFIEIRQYNYDLLTNLCDDLDKNFKDIILEGVVNNKSVDEIANELEIAGISPLNKHTAQQRAKMIARTEVNSVKNKARLQAYKDNNIEWVDIVTMHDLKVCGDCLSLEANNPYHISEVEGLLPVHPNCYDDETEVYTKDGWKLFNDVSLEDEILTLNPETKLTEFVKPVRLISYTNNDGYMYVIHNKWYNSCVTSNHDCFVYQRKMIESERKLIPEFRKPLELNSESRFLRTINNNNISPKYVDVNGLKFTPKDYAFFMAWYISEGSILHNDETAKKKKYPIKITQIKKDNRRLLEKELVRIADYLNIKLYIGENYFEFHSKKLHDYLKPLGYSHEKYIPKEIFNLSREDLWIFLDMYVKGDGHKRNNEKCLFTSSKQLADDLSYVALLGGYNPSVFVNSKKGKKVKHHNGIYVQKHDVYCVRLNTSEYTFMDSCSIDKISYDGKVYCIELPKYHTLWIKRNNQTSWNGNCRCVYAKSDKNNNFNNEFDEFI